MQLRQSRLRLHRLSLPLQSLLSTSTHLVTDGLIRCIGLDTRIRTDVQCLAVKPLIEILPGRPRFPRLGRSRGLPQWRG